MTDAPPPSSSRLGWWAAALAVPAAVVAFHWRAAAPGQALVGLDLRHYFYAVREATAAALRAGHLPGWQRGLFLGYPLMGDPQIAVFDPGTWLTLPWGAARALTLAALIHLCVGGWGMLAWLRRRGLLPLEATLGALLFALAAKQTAHLQHWNFAASMAWWPWMLAGLEGFAADGRGRHLALTAGAAALSWFGGAAQMAYFGTLVAGAYALALAPALWRRRRADALLALAAAPLGLVLAAPMVLPVMELARHGPRGAGVGYRFVTSWSWPDRWAWALFLVPRAFGGAWYRAEMNAWEATGYLGILPLGLMALAPLRRRGLWLFALLGVVGVWLCWGEGGWLGLHRAFWRWLPGYGSFRNPTRSLMVTALASALLAAEGLSALRAGEVRGRRALAAGVLAAAALAALVLPRLPGFTLDAERGRAEALCTAALAAAGVAWLAAGRWLAGPGRPAWARAAWAAAPFALVLVDLQLAFGDFNPTGPAAAEVAALADVPALAPAAPAPRRVAVQCKWGRTANATLRRDLEGVTGYGPTVIQRVRSLLEATQTDALYPPSAVESDTDFPRVRPTSRLWPLLGAPLLVTDRPCDLPVVAPLRPEYDVPTRAYRTPALPRAFWVGSWSRAPDAAIRDPILEAARGDRAVLADDAPVAAFPAPGAPEGPVAAAAVAVEGGALQATLTAPRDGAAVVLEPWYPGWRATVDGRPAPIARADFAFMAVPLPRGTHALRLEYHPALVAPGFAVGLGAAALLAAALAWRRRTAPRRP